MANIYKYNDISVKFNLINQFKFNKIRLNIKLIEF